MCGLMRLDMGAQAPFTLLLYRGRMNMTKQIPLTNCDKYTLVDDEDYERLSKWSWYLKDDGYVVRSTSKTVIRIHREIMGVTDPSLIVDHRNHNVLDNQKENLRVTNRSGNMMNAGKRGKNKYKGVRYIPKNNCYQARISVNKRSITIGHFTNEDAAANAYNFYAKIHHGEFAYYNDVEHMPQEEWEKHMTRKRGILL